MAIADSIMSEVRAARTGDGQCVDSDEASRIVTQLRAKVPSLRGGNGQTQLRQTLDKLGKQKLLTQVELETLRAAVEGDPARLSPNPTVRTHPAPHEGLHEMYGQHHAGEAAPNEGYHAIRSRLMQTLHEAQGKHDNNHVHAARDLVEALDHRFGKAAGAERPEQIDRWLNVQWAGAEWPTLEQIRARAFGRNEPANIRRE
jgi:hypothetical protein